MQEFLAMGGYARYVWPSYGITFAAVFINIWMARRLLRNAQADARRRIAVNADGASAGGSRNGGTEGKEHA